MAGFAATLLLQALVEPRVFPQGDNGLKFLQARQLVEGEWRLDLALPARGWERELWLDGFFPFRPPSVVRSGDRFFSTYPPLFPLLSALPYALFGYRGLFLLPLVATWAIWIVAGRACLALRLSRTGTRVALVLLIVASPVTLNCWLFWEHTPALALAFGGVSLLLLRPFARAPRRREALAAGALVGLSAFLREEMLLVGGVLLALTLVPRPARWLWLPRLGGTRGAFALGLGSLWAVLFGFNAVAFGHPLGLHALHVGLAAGLAERFSPSQPDLVRPFLIGNRTLIEHFPELLLCPLVLLPARGRAGRALPRARLLVLLAVGYWLALRFTVLSDGGKVWGPRLLLFIVPPSCLALGACVDALRPRRSWAARGALALLAALGAAGAWTDGYLEVRELAGDYAYRAKALRVLLARPETLVVYSHHYVGHQFASAFGEKTFFLTHRGSGLQRLASSLARQGAERFLFLCDPTYGCDPLGESVQSLAMEVPGGLRLKLVLIGTAGRYLVYAARLQPARTRQRAPRPAGQPAPALKQG